MTTTIAILVSGVFVILALWHIRMAFGSLSGESVGVPSIDGKPLFVPSRASTLLVALFLLACAGLVAVTSGLVQLGVPARVPVWACCALALGLFARAVGEFRYVGFFKRVRGSRFARLDTMVYSPLCLVLAVGVAVVAFGDAS
jgi:hypothetical protein